MGVFRTQEWDPAQYAEQARFVSDLGQPVVDLLNPRRGERILDLGCGDGALSAKLVKAGAAVVALDASEAMVRAARALGLDADVGDGESLDFVDEFDAVFSNAALHWMMRPERVIAGVWRALRPGGRFVAEFGGDGNVAAIVTALESALLRRGLTVSCPWFFPGIEDYRRLLQAVGFKVRAIELIPRPTVLPGDVGGWLKTFAQPYIASLPESERASFFVEVVDVLRDVLCDRDGVWRADYVRLRFAAFKPDLTERSSQPFTP